MQTVLHLSDEDAARIGPESTPLVVPNWNSLAHVQIILELERAFRVTFEADDLRTGNQVAIKLEATQLDPPFVGIMSNGTSGNIT